MGEGARLASDRVGQVMVQRQAHSVTGQRLVPDSMRLRDSDGRRGEALLVDKVLEVRPVDDVGHHESLRCEW